MQRAAGERVLTQLCRYTFGRVGLPGKIHGVGRSAAQHKAPIAIAAIDISALVDLEKDARMTECCRTITRAAANGACAITAHTAFVDANDFGRRNAHDANR